MRARDKTPEEAWRDLIGALRENATQLGLALAALWCVIVLVALWVAAR